MTKRLMLASLLMALALPAGANAALCRNKIYNDWLADGKIASTYSHACYVDALHHIPQDASVYSSLRDDITAAMRANARRADGKAAPSEVGHGFTTQNVLASSNTPQTTTSPASSSSSSPSSSLPPSSHDPAVGEKTAGGATLASSKSGAPVPVLVLGGLALVLLAAGAVGAGVKHSRSRRS